MRILAWNMNGAKAESHAWELFSELRPDIALLQEVGEIPGHIKEIFEINSKKAITKYGKPQRFSTAVIVKGRIIEEIRLYSEYEGVNRKLDFFKGNFVACVVHPACYKPINVVSVYSPAWPVNEGELTESELFSIKLKENPKLWATELIWAALKNIVPSGGIWIVGGDYNSSETFDTDWQKRNKKRYGIRSSGNREIWDRMHTLGFTECLRKYNDEITPTFKHSRGSLSHQIDHLFVQNSLYSKIISCTVGDSSKIFDKNNKLSDHLPIIADFRV